MEWLVLAYGIIAIVLGLVATARFHSTMDRNLKKYREKKGGEQ